MTGSVRVCVAALGPLFLGLALPASARPFRVWYADELAQKADVIVMATVLSNRDDHDFSKEAHKPDDLVTVLTTFGVDAVLKGDVPGTIRSKEGQEIEVAHQRYFDPQSNIRIIDGASLTQFDAEKHPRILLFLQKTTSGRFMPLTGGYDDFQSFVELGKYFGMAKERLPIANPKPTAPQPEEPQAQTKDK